MTKDEIRDQLIELLKTNACPSPYMCDPTCVYYDCADCFSYRFADHLLAHGVTIQRWIPDAEQTPKEDPETGYIDVAVLTKGGKIQIATWDGSNYYIEISSSEDLGDTITHWAYLPPLPQAPKEVE